MTGDCWLVSDVFLSIGRMAGSRWPVDLQSSGYKYPWSCHLDGSSPGQQGHVGWWSYPIFFIWWIRYGFFLAMTHFLEVQVLLSLASFQVLSDQELHVEQVDSLEQEEYFIHLLWLSQHDFIWPHSPRRIVIKVAKTHYNKRAMDNYKKSIYNKREYE